MLTAKIVHQESQKDNFKLSEIYIVTNDNKVAIRLAGLFDKEQILHSYVYNVTSSVVFWVQCLYRMRSKTKPIKLVFMPPC